MKRSTQQQTGIKGKFTLIVGDEGAILVLMKGKKVLRRLYARDAEPESSKALVGLLENNPGSPVSILLDVIDQSYTRHTLPPVSPLGVNQLVQRRLKRDFAEDDLKGYISLGREKEGRKDWNFLLISVPQSDLLKSWLDLILELPNMFTGVYLSPVEGQNYIQAIHKSLPKLESGKVPQWQMLVSHNKVSGYRQIVLKHGKLFFARVAQAAQNDAAAVAAGNIEQEILNTLEYLRRMGLDEESLLEIYIVSGQEIVDSIDARRFDAVRTELFVPADLSEQLGLEQAAVSGDRFGDVLMVAGFSASSKKALKLPIPYAETLNKLHLGSLVMKAASVLIVLGALGFIGMQAPNILEFSEEYDKLQGEERQKQEELRRVQDIASELPADAKKISEVVTVWNAVNSAEMQTFESIKNKLSGILVEDVRITRFDINQTAPFASETDDGNRSRSTNGEVEAEPLFSVTLSLEFFMDNPTETQFLTRAGEYLETVKAVFSDYDVSYRTLFKDKETDDEAIELNFDDLKDGNQLVSNDLLTTDLIIAKYPEEQS